MQKYLEELKNKFEIIKNNKFNESLRNGSTGIGYTFESLLGKEEDSSYEPDFNGIEIKTKLGYSKSPMTLFSLTPKKDHDYAIKYILDNFGYPSKNKIEKNFRGNVYCNINNVIANKYILKVKIDKLENKLILFIYNIHSTLINNEIYWDLDNLEERLYTKLKYLALIKGYKYIKDGKTFYKYTSLNMYKLRGFDMFLKLIENDKIFLTFNIGTRVYQDGSCHINDRGTAFRINISCINELFEKID